jgi:hypothetical protein
MKTLFISQDLWDLVEKGYSATVVSADTLKELRKKDARRCFSFNKLWLNPSFPKLLRQQSRRMLVMHYRMGIKVMPRY